MYSAGKPQPVELRSFEEWLAVAVEVQPTVPVQRHPQMTFGDDDDLGLIRQCLHFHQIQIERIPRPRQSDWN